MLPYWLLFSMFAVGALGQSQRSEPDRRTPMLTLAALLAAIMIGLRYRAGADWENYAQWFLAVKYADLGEALSFADPGYTGLNWIAHQLGFGIWFVNLVCGLILMIGLLAFARQQPNPWLAGLVAVPYLIIVVAMGYTRQGVALGFCFAGLAALHRSKSLLRFALYMFPALFFHKSAIVLLPLVAVSLKRNRFVTITSAIFMAIFLFYFLISSDVTRLYSVYIEAEYESEGALVRILMNVVPAVIYLLAQKSFTQDEDERILWRNMSLASLFMLALLFVFPSTTAVDRIALFLIPLQLYVFSRFPTVFARGGRRDPLMALLVIAYYGTTQFIWFNYASFAEYWLPYQAYFIDEPADAI